MQCLWKSNRPPHANILIISVQKKNDLCSDIADVFLCLPNKALICAHSVWREFVPSRPNMAVKQTGTDALATERADEGTADELCSDLLMRMPDDVFLRIPCMVSLNILVSLRILSKAIKSRIDEISLHIPGVGARMFPFVRSTNGFLELQLAKLVALLRHPNLTFSTAEVMESAMAWVNHVCLALRCRMSCSTVAGGIS